jgi:putative acetyltransferase
VSCFGRAVRESGARYDDREQIAARSPASPDMDAWANRLSAGGVFVADMDGQIAGFVRVEVEGDNGLVDLIYVHPEYARRGLGRELLEVGCTWAVAKEARKLESEVSLESKVSIGLALYLRPWISGGASGGALAVC